MVRIAGFLQIAVFVVFLASPLALPLVGISGGRLAVENRPLAALPSLAQAWSNPAGYGPALAAHVRDAAPFRDHLIRLGSRVRLALFDESPVPGVIVGREGWLYYNLEQALDDYLNVVPLSEHDMDEMVRVQTERRDWLQARGVAYCIVFAPNKERVYPDFLPAGLHPLAPTSRLGQIVPRLRAAGIAVLDLREPLTQARTIQRTYLQTDTHWNGFGGLVGASTLVAALGRQFPAMEALDIRDYELLAKDRPGGDLAEMLLLPDIWQEHDIVPRKRTPALARPASPGNYPDPADHPERERAAYETGRADWPRAVFFHDSFARAMQPFAAERFSRSVFLWTHAFWPDIIEAERPDVVVLEVVERYVFALLVDREPVRNAH
ncbi:alginate O-acetyltransferase AlgX-related protein [Desulfovibrio sp. TomC]|uniref:alginate O-acetyltransferase AlgX-related protein n=1 Tax=Desulfovibrio sp. TomC TaxID=1562888 RepID=UPI000573DEC8|nr:hypothetical protein [Desulfovibrio sp. TomC]KHK01283.1 Alginate biosynthesis protein AlgJ [Desulfovibrio sp. TomC]